MKIFNNADFINVPGRGRVAHVRVRNPDRIMRPKALPEVDEIVAINDILYKVRGLELTKLLVDPPYLSESVGLLVTEVK